MHRDLLVHMADWWRQVKTGRPLNVIWQERTHSFNIYLSRTHTFSSSPCFCYKHSHTLFVLSCYTHALTQTNSVLCNHSNLHTYQQQFTFMSPATLSLPECKDTCLRLRVDVHACHMSKVPHFVIVCLCVSVCALWSNLFSNADYF